MNSISVSGILGKDSEKRFLSNNDPVLNFSVADSQGRDKPTIWWNCSLFGKRAESLEQYLKKGTNVTVIGNVSMREYTDNAGVKKQAYDVRVVDIALQGGKQQEQAPATAPAPAPKRSGKPKPDFSDMDDDIPF